VPRIDGCSYEVVELDAQRFFELVEAGSIRVDKRLCVDTRGFRSERVLQRMVVGAAEQADFVAGRPVEPGESVRLNKLKRVAEMRPESRFNLSRLI
jgi:hypothetical protein